MKRIVLITSFFSSPYHKNRAPYNELLFEALAHHYDIDIIRPIAWTDIFRTKNRFRKKDYYHSKWQGMDIYYPTYYFLPKFAPQLRGRLYLQSIVKSFECLGYIPNIFYTTWAYPDAYATMLLARKYKRNYILRVHGSDINVLLKLESVQGKILEVLHGAAAIVSPSQKLKEIMVEAGIDNGKIHVIYSGIDKTNFKPLSKFECEKALSLDNTLKRILYIGNLKKEKGVLDLLHAAARLKDKRGSFELLYVGEGQERENLLKIAEQYGMKNHVRLVGMVDHHHLPLWINSSDVVALPSYSEGVPNVVLEAMACNKNIVATNVGGIPEVVKNPEMLIAPGDIVGLIEQLEKAINGQALQSRSAIELISYKKIVLLIKKDLIEQFSV